MERGDFFCFMVSIWFFGVMELKDCIYVMFGLVFDNDRDGIEIIYFKNVLYGDVY